MGIECFISAEALKMHREHLSALGIKSAMCHTRGEKELVENEIRAHELYFSSFHREHTPCQRIKEGYQSENRFCFLLSEYAKSVRCGFIYIYPCARHPFVGFGSSDRALSRAVLAIDLWEHAYFLDYGFDFSSYITQALAHLDFSRLK